VLFFFFFVSAITNCALFVLCLLGGSLVGDCELVSAGVPFSLMP